jgi:putative membrane protein
MLDLILAIAHHLLIFGLFAVLLIEFILVRPGMDRAAVQRVAGVDLSYGVMAGLILVIGFARAIFAAKGWDYYAHNGFFWAKIITFALIGLLSVAPTLRYLRWRKSGALPGAAEIASVRRLLHAQLGLFPLLLVFAAAMARGYGSFS